MQPEFKKLEEIHCIKFYNYKFLDCKKACSAKHHMLLIQF
ncbi:hypothetical protein GCM10008968_31890 [Bacillus horti]